LETPEPLAPIEEPEQAELPISDPPATDPAPEVPNEDTPAES
jgi:hypothetical protein